MKWYEVMANNYEFAYIFFNDDTYWFEPITNVKDVERIIDIALEGEYVMGNSVVVEWQERN